MSRSSRLRLRSSFSIQPPYRELLPSSTASLIVLKASDSLTGLVAFSTPRPAALTPFRTPCTADVSQVHAAPDPTALAVPFSALAAVEVAACCASRARLTPSDSVNWLTEEPSCFVDSFHSFEALNSEERVSLNTCHGVLSP